MRKTPSFSNFFSSLSSKPVVSPPPPDLLGSSRPMRERCKYIPLRLSWEERKYLRLVEAALTVCDYTARVDRPFKNPAQREFAQLRNISAIVEVRTKGRRSRGNCRHNERGFDYGCVSLVLLFQGFVFSSDYEQGQSLASEREYKQHEGFYQRLIEIARRHKIMNPEKMRGEYGKLLYLLQDSVSSNMQSQLGFSFITGISTGTVN